MYNNNEYLYIKKIVIKLNTFVKIIIKINLNFININSYTKYYKHGRQRGGGGGLVGYNSP